MNNLHRRSFLKTAAALGAAALVSRSLTSQVFAQTAAPSRGVLANVKGADYFAATQKAVALLGDFCDTDTLQNRIELIDDVKDRLLMELGDSENDEERKTLTDWMISLSDMKEDLKKIRRAQQ